LWRRVLRFHASVLLSDDARVLLNGGAGGGSLREYGLLGLCHGDQYLNSLAWGEDMRQRGLSLL
jgi:hypothetical protein